LVPYAEDDASNRSHTGDLTRVEATRGCKDLHACGTRTPWAYPALALAKRTIPNGRDDGPAYLTSRVTSFLPKIGGERLAKKISLTWSLVDTAVAARRSRPKVVATPHDATFLLVEVPRHLEGMWRGPRHTYRGMLAHASAPEVFRSFPRFFSVWNPGTCAVVLPAPLPPLRSRVHREAMFRVWACALTRAHILCI
jgi:hypothetical protein